MNIKPKLCFQDSVIESERECFQNDNEYEHQKTEKKYNYLHENISIEQIPEKSFPSQGCLSNQQSVKASQRWGEEKLQQPFWNTLIMAILGGVFINFGSLFSESIGSGLQHTLIYQNETQKRVEGFGYRLLSMALVYPIGIILSFLIGAEYFTANLCLFPSAVVHRTARIVDVMKFQVLCLMGNIFGGIIFAWVIGYWTGNLNHLQCAQIAEERMEAGFGTQLIKGMGFAWVLSQAVLIYISAQSIFSKSFGLWWPIFGLFCMGYEDIVSNIFIMTTGMMNNANIAFGDYIGYSFLPQLLGHVISSTFLVGLYYTYIYNWPQPIKK